MKYQLITIKNAIMHNSLFAKFKFTNFNLNICKLFLKNGIITHYKKIKHKSDYILILFLKYYQHKNILRSINIVSTNGRSISTTNKNIFFKKNSLLISTSNGIVFQSNIKNYSIGGKVLFFINC